LKTPEIESSAGESANHILLPMAVGAVFLVALVLGAMFG